MPLTYKPRAEAYEVVPPKISPNSFLGDILASSDTAKPLAAGFFKVVPGEPLVYTYPYDEFKIVLEVQGTFTISDEENNVVTPKPGDVLYFPKGTTITFKVEGGEDAYSYNFYVGAKALNEL